MRGYVEGLTGGVGWLELVAGPPVQGSSEGAVRFGPVGSGDVEAACPCDDEEQVRGAAGPGARENYTSTLTPPPGQGPRHPAEPETD